MDEVWVDIPKYSRYQVSNLGSVRSVDVEVLGKTGIRYTKKGVTLTPIKDSYGYHIVTLYGDTTRVNKKVHRLVAEAFTTNTSSKPQVNHINGIKTDNRADNLEWCTSLENIAHARQTGLSIPAGRRWVPDCDVISIRLWRLEGFTLQSIATAYGISFQHVSDLCNYKRRSNVV